MLTYLAGLIAPHYCVSCERIGAILCNRCQIDIIDQWEPRCIICKVLTGDAGVCGLCQGGVVYTGAWAASERDMVIARLIDEYKLRHNRDALSACANLLDMLLPVLPPHTVATPVPTIRPHVRQRGYAHAELLAREFANHRGLPYASLLTRRVNYVQRGSSRRERIRQAHESYVCAEAVSSEVPYLIIDDVVTTGATLDAVTRALAGRGARQIYVAVVACQPVDEQ